jgi:RNA polymerase sigma-70 factor (ECF subfamily)
VTFDPRRFRAAVPPCPVASAGRTLGQAALAAVAMADDPSPVQRDSRTDEVLMSAFRDGEAWAFEVLVFRHRRGLFNFLLRSVHNQSRAEELLQDVFLRVVRAKERYEKTARFSTWVYTIARNLCVDESRRARFRQHVSLEERRPGREQGDRGASLLELTAADQVPTDDAADRPRLQHRMAAAIEQLPEDQREVFLMRQLGGLSFKEIGDVVGAPENTVKSRMRYALEKLRSELADLDPRQPAAARKAGVHG